MNPISSLDWKNHESELAYAANNGFDLNSFRISTWTALTSLNNC